MSDSFRPHELYSPWNSLGQTIGVGSQPFPSPGHLPIPGIEPRSPTLQADSLPAEPLGKPRILEWVAYPNSTGSSQPRNRTRVSCIADRFFTSWATRESKKKVKFKVVQSCLTLCDPMDYTILSLFKITTKSICKFLVVTKCSWVTYVNFKLYPLSLLRK